MNKCTLAVVHEYPRTDKNTANENIVSTFGLILHFTHNANIPSKYETSSDNDENIMS